MTSWAERLAATAAKAVVQAVKGKGKGKGAPTGNSKDKVYGGKQEQLKPLKQGQWQCLCADCDWATLQKANYGFRKACGGCGAQKSDAMHPPAKFRVQP